MNIVPRSVFAVIPTRGDLDLTYIVDHLMTYPEIRRVCVRTGNTPWNRYLAAIEAPESIIYTQDDDCLTDIRPLLDAFRPGEGVMVNAMTPQHAGQYRDSRFTLCGFGAIFDKSMLGVFDGYERDALFFRESDRIMGSVPHRTVYPSIFISSDANRHNRLWRQPEHNSTRRLMEQRILQHDRNPLSHAQPA